MEKSRQLETDQLTVNENTVLCGKLHVKQVGGCGLGAVFDAPVCFNDTVKGPLNCIDVQENGVDQINNPFKTLNFIGDSVTVTDAGDNTVNINVAGGTGGESGDCIMQDNSEVCVVDTSGEGGGEGEGEEGSGSHIYMNVDGNEYWRLKSFGGLQHGTNVTVNGANSLSSGGPLLLGGELGNYFDGPNNSGIVSQAFGSENNINPGVAGCFACGIDNRIQEGTRSSHIEGIGNRIQEDVFDSHVQGSATNMLPLTRSCHSEGVDNTIGFGVESAHAEGANQIVNGDYGHAEGNGQTIGPFATAGHAEGLDNMVTDQYSHAQGRNCNVESPNSFGGGWYSRTYHPQDWAYQASRFSNAIPGALNSNGDTQCRKLIFRNYCPASSTTSLYIGEGSAAPIVRSLVRNGASWVISGLVVARSYDGDVNASIQCRGWKVKAVVDRTSSFDTYSGLKLVGQTITPIYEPNSAITLAWYLDGGAGAPSQPYIRATTDASSAWHVVMYWDITEIVTNSIRTNIV